MQQMVAGLAVLDRCLEKVGMCQPRQADAGSGRGWRVVRMEAFWGGGGQTSGCTWLGVDQPG